MSRDATTADQRRIEVILATIVTPGSRILHVGIGNSSLALGLRDQNVEIIGLTFNEREKRHADRLGLGNYQSLVANKFTDDLDVITTPFDFIIDNNPSSFACCVMHFEYMLAQYVRLLKPGALMLTDREGMAWCYGDGPMRLGLEDLQSIARVYPFTIRRLSDDVVALQRTH